MGFWQNLVESYDKNAETLKLMYPLSTTTISNASKFIGVIVLDANGDFVRLKKIEKKSDATKKKIGNPLVIITIPASEESLRRTSTAISPYPVFDQYEYLKGFVGKSDMYIKKFYNHCEHVRAHIKRIKGNKKEIKSNLKKWKDYAEKIKENEVFGRKFDAYISQLKKFAESEFATEEVKAIFKYVSKRTIDYDLLGDGFDDKTNIVFEIEIPGNPQTKLWEDKTFFEAWNGYYQKEMENAKIWDLDYITGEQQPLANSHPKKIINSPANAKLITDNDDANFTFRGKFNNSSEAFSIGYGSSQKAHQFLRYLINDRGNSCGEQVILSFMIGITAKLLPPPIDDHSIAAILQESIIQTDSDKQISIRAETGIDYAEALRKSLDGFGYNKTLIQHAKTAVIALNATTENTGRLSITFYRELDRNEYLENIANWHTECKWNQQFWSTENNQFIPYIGAPSVEKIIQAVYGKPRGSRDESYIKIKKAARERLLRCIFDKALLPRDFVVAAVRRASNPLGVTTNGKFDRNGFEQLLSTTCALIRKDYQQRNKEVYKLSIELDRTDRGYLYGRLLGAADKLEEYALYKKDKDRVVTAAIRHMQAFAQRPYRTWQTIHSCLNPYIQTVKGGFAFNEIQAVNQLFVFDDYENDTPLDGLYLLGYYHERAYIDSKVKAANEKKKSTDNI